ncbi:MAG: hypothetical protein A2855_02300 [Candidatus Liptonbacteria bacterium RIFCSPHIGHO2_01_FULL_57_28]|uniref:EamA domain-containing protein n=1 Tax=Candidatus Liptonbacteria bacterium RIFCSPHIGHO2_01_FULL_57_28 TaxID=1798647 RepID=A0A1G2CAS1_9BACT|nr:MAG: hypothetical protein A2855_02300 [Candidatus Liptonbacteria bacterium RIFCSPHIGHO2_01_FULL_57_28]
MGIAFSLIALVSWGLGDFLIQRSARKFGDWIAIFYITAFGSVVLLPFVYREIGPLFWNLRGLYILLAASVVITFAAYFDFEALRVGKISVIEPIYAFEIAVTAALSVFVIQEKISAWQALLIAAIILGIFLVSTKSFHHLRNIKWEKGVILAIIATAAMGAANFLFGIGARDTSPLLINWFTDVFITFVALCFIIAQSRFGEIATDLKHNKRLIFGVSIMDNLAWIAFTYATLYIPIAIATGISESYIALAVLLGVKFNKEKLEGHQKFGLVLTVLAAIILALITQE